MMRPSVVLLLMLFPIAASAEGSANAQQPTKGELQLIYVFEGSKPEFLFVIGQVGFKSVTSLEKHLESWAPGSELKWAPGCERLGGEPLLSSEKDMKAFRAFLAKRGIHFTLVPSG